MKISKIGFLTILCIIQVSTFAQDISKYLQDDGFSTGKNMVKIGLDPLNGELPIIFEHALGNNAALEIHTGLLFLKYQDRLYPENTLPIPASGLGYTVSGAAKIYLKSFPERSYIAFRPGISVMSGKLFADIAIFNYGYQRAIFGKWFLDFEMGFGLRLFKDTNPESEMEFSGTGFRIIFPVSIKTGYLF